MLEILVVFTAVRNVVKLEATVEKPYCGNNVKCVGHAFSTGVSEIESFYNELHVLMHIENKKHSIAKECLRNFPSLILADFRKLTITQTDMGDTLTSRIGSERVVNMSMSTFLKDMDCISSSLSAMNLMHCDMQPKNFVIDANRVTSIIDFDMAYITYDTQVST